MTDPLDTDLDEGELADSAWLLADHDHPPENYGEVTNDYIPGSKLLLDRIEEQWFR